MARLTIAEPYLTRLEQVLEAALADRGSMNVLTLVNMRTLVNVLTLRGEGTGAEAARSARTRGEQ